MHHETEEKKLEVIKCLGTSRDLNFLTRAVRLARARKEFLEALWSIESSIYVDTSSGRVHLTKELVDLFDQEKKINAIKVVRDETGMSVKDAKEAIEGLMVLYKSRLDAINKAPATAAASALEYDLSSTLDALDSTDSDWI
jgi:hypothetical protein